MLTYDILSQDIVYLKGVGPRRAKVLKESAGVFSLRDLLYFFPHKYVDRSKIYNINELEEGMPNIQIIGKVKSVYEAGIGRRKRLEAIADDGTGSVKLVWFGGVNYIKKHLQTNVDYLIFGKPSTFNHDVNIVQPEMTLLDTKEKIRGVTRLHPVYSVTESMRDAGITSNVVEQMTEALFERLQKTNIPETLPEYFLNKYNLAGLADALYTIHFPDSMENVRKAERRLKFEELFFIQLEILCYAEQRTRKYRGLVFRKVGENFMHFFNENLPFELTNAQKRVMKEIRNDLGSGLQMNRLLQGDVGSGKTMVALMSMLIAMDNGYQSCLMAPTEILAEQHYNTITKMLNGMNMRVEMLTGNVQGKKREQILKDLLSGEINILIGTHAVLGDLVSFKNLGLAVIDEQHRFGVEQRAKLWQKNDSPPHILVMTATPIPRTLAMTVYGDLDVSVIDELPPGRKAIKTLHCYDEAESNWVSLVQKEIDAGRQIYIVYPLIEESEKSDLLDLDNGYKHICKIFPKLKVGKLHGRMKETEKNEVMDAFKQGTLHILVSTTVIEVGVDVPNASVMVIKNANRFGLSQLHQLRGRVGRGAEQSYCILMTGYKLPETSRKRLEIMVDSSDGFYIAEEDLKLRGPGVLDGTQQSGVIFNLKIANVIKDNGLLVEARMAAQELLKQDPSMSLPSNKIIWNQMLANKKSKVDLSNIS